MKNNPENPYYSQDSFENRVQGDFESTIMRLDKVMNFTNSPEDKKILKALIGLGYNTVGEVVDAIKTDKIDESTNTEIFVQDVRVSVPIYTSALNFLYRHNLIDKAVKLKEDAGKLDYGVFKKSDDYDPTSFENQKYKNPLSYDPYQKVKKEKSNPNSEISLSIIKKIESAGYTHDEYKKAIDVLKSEGGGFPDAPMVAFLAKMYGACRENDDVRQAIGERVENPMWATLEVYVYLGRT